MLNEMGSISGSATNLWADFECFEGRFLANFVDSGWP